MTAVLAIDTANQTTGVAVAVEGRIRAQLLEATAARHSERLLRLVDAALQGAGVERTDLACVAVTVGPGSFTGVRVGVATAKGIAFALEIPVAGVSSLKAMAWGSMPFPGLVVPLLDARKRQVYAAAYDGLSGSCVLEEAAWGPEDLVQEIRALETTCLVLGSGLGPYAGLFRAAAGEKCLIASPTRWCVPPGEVAVLGHQMWVEGRAVAPRHLAPTYCRPSEAEESRSSLDRRSRSAEAG